MSDPLFDGEQFAYGLIHGLSNGGFQGAQIAEHMEAIAYEQRTANLIAAFAQLNEGEDESLLGERMDGLELAKEIKERLDFK